MFKNKFATLIGLAIFWFITFIACFRIPQARGVSMAVGAVCILWFAYWTISVLRGNDSQPEEKKEQTNDETQESSK